MTLVPEQSSAQPFLRAPAVVLWLIAVLIGAHALRDLVFPHADYFLFHNYGFVPSRYSPSFLAAHHYNPGSILARALPFVTYMFLHGSWAHVLINSVWLLAFGPVVARRYGTLLFLLFFLTCGAAGAAVHLAWNWESDAPVVGASAAIAGLMAAGFRMLRFGPEELAPSLAPILSPRVLLWTALWVVVNIVAGVTGLGTGGSVQLIAWQAHLGGYGAGLLLAGPFDQLAGRKTTAPA